MLKVYYAKIDPLYNQEKYLAYYQALPKTRQKRTDNYVDAEDRMRSVAAFTLLLKLLNDNKVSYQNDDFKIDQYGKLYLVNSDVYLNLSHSGSYVIAAISDAPVGVDVEHIEKNHKIKELIKYVLDNKEIEEFSKSKNQIKDFYLMWTKKESYTKCIGKGLSAGMNTININKIKDFHFKCFDKENHQFAICYKAKLVIDSKEIEL
ncbi:MAG: 4'-phosphopantetheinyl transferase superfamily protein [Bacilli bacterium]|nr:4'-phosphopantetheinyl transferase superfamily protein [Bacilli bacterium]